MARECVALTDHIRNLSIVGVWEAVKNLGKIRSQYARLTEEIKTRKPSLAILIDYPGFNLKVAHFLKKENVPVIYYVVPQVWAWGEWRVKELRENVAKCLTLFSFEEQFLRDRGVTADFVGNPLLDAAPENTVTAHDGFTIALLPGSRKSEISSLFPLMLSAAEIIKASRKDVKFILAESSNVPPEMYAGGLSLHPSLAIERMKDATYKALALSDFVIVASGTATLETAVMEKPMAVVYKVTLLTEVLFKMISKLRLVSLVNIIAGVREIVPEFTQRHKAFPEKIARGTLDVINDESRMEEMRSELRKVKKTLGPKGASKRAAEAIAIFAREKKLL
jgi:lipid-A-disaccharide synthase